MKNQLKNDLASVEEMLSYARKAVYVHQELLKHDSSFNDEIRMDTIVFYIGQIGEQQTNENLSKTTQNNYSYSWKEIKGLQNLLLDSFKCNSMVRLFPI